MKIEIFSKTTCPLCGKAKQWMDRHGIVYEETLLDNDGERMKFYAETDTKSVPQIFIDGKHIGGYTEFLDHTDDILRKSPGSLTEFSKTYKPFRYPWAVEITTRHESAHWIEDEIDLADDVSDWKSGKLSDTEKEFITNILRLFTQSDVAVGQNYYDQFIPKFKNNEVRNMLGSFAAREGIHQRAYALLNDTLGLPDSEYHAFLKYSEMTDKIEHMQNSDSNTVRGLGLALAKSMFNEGVSLFASFVMLLNFQRFGKMKGMGKVVEWSLRDEALECGTGVVTNDGVKLIENITLDDEVLQFDLEKKQYSYVKPTKTQKVVRNESYEFEHPEFYQCVSANHRMIYEEDGVIKECLAKDFVPADNKYFLVVDKRIKSTDVEITHRKHEPRDFHCLAVPGKAFVVEDDNGNRSITGNTIHVEGISKLFRAFCAEHPRIVDEDFKKAIYQMARDSVKLEDRFLQLAYKMGEIEGLTEADVKKYIRFITDRRLLQMGLKPNYHVKENPISWLEYIINAPDHSNFFETTVTEYEVAGLTGEWEEVY